MGQSFGVDAKMGIAATSFTQMLAALPSKTEHASEKHASLPTYRALVEHMRARLKALRITPLQGQRKPVIRTRQQEGVRLKLAYSKDQQ